MQSIVFIILLSYIHITIQQQEQCPINQISIDGKKCTYAETPSLIGKNYSDAESDCKQRAANAGSDVNRTFLVSIPNSNENRDVTVFATSQLNCSEYYIGLNNIDNILRWSDGSVYNYSNWSPGCPTVSINESDRCVTINSNGTWCNRNCANLYCYICEIPSIIMTTTAKPTTTTTCTTTLSSNSMTDCYDWLHINGSNSSGIYQIDLGCGFEPFDVYCDMTTDGGGWTVIQSSEMWNNTWQQYKNGFNNSIENGSLWLGNDRIHVMTSRWNVTLRVEINGEQWPNNNPNLYLYGKYYFSISDETNNYTLYISFPIEGNASDAGPDGFIYNNDMPFSTVDKSNSQYGSYCANIRQYGGWWFNDNECTDVALNGKYNPTIECHGFVWYSSATDDIEPKRSEMKIRRQ